MIVDSISWKNDINTVINKLSKINTKKFTEKTSYELEKYFFITSYSIRKLYQSGKISDSLFKKDIVLYYYKPIKHINRISWWDIDELYDFETPIKCSIQLKYLLEQLIHSYTFTPIYNFNDKTESIQNIKCILFHSDKERNKKTYSMTLSQYIDILKEVSSNYPSSMKSRFDEKEDDYILEVGDDDWKTK